MLDRGCRCQTATRTALGAASSWAGSLESDPEIADAASRANKIIKKSLRLKSPEERGTGDGAPKRQDSGLRL